MCLYVKGFRAEMEAADISRRSGIAANSQEPESQHRDGCCMPVTHSSHRSPAGWLIYNPAKFPTTQVAFMLSALTPLEFLSRNAIAYQDCTAVIDGDRRFTYSEMQRRVHAFGAALQQAGISAADRVAVLGRNGVQPVAAHYAAPLLRAVR